MIGALEIVLIILGILAGIWLIACLTQAVLRRIR